MATTPNFRLSYAPAAAKRMASAANRFIELLSSEQTEAARFPFAGDERYIWNYTPVPRNGLLLKDMEESQREAGMALMATGLSERGDQKAREIIDLETSLDEWERMQGAPENWSRDPDLYWFSIFGDPGSDGPWGWRVGGHHVCLHYTVVDGNMVTPNPLFFGANPAEIQHGEHKGKRTLPEEEDMARSLLGSLDATQRAQAIVDETAPADILTKSYRRAERDAAPVGLQYPDMGADSRELLVQIVRHYVERSSEDLAANEWHRIERAGLDGIAFAWAGPEEPRHGHYYAIKNDDFLIEYDNTQNEANHIHSVFRGYDTDFGEDLLAAHYEQTIHG